MRRVFVAFLALLLGTLLLPSQVIAADNQQQRSKARSYLVLYSSSASVSAARAAVEAAGGEIVSENTKVGVATVRSRAADFTEAARRQEALAGAARNQPIGTATPEMQRKEAIEGLPSASGDSGRTVYSRRGGPEPLADLQWNNRMVQATKQGSYRVQRGDPGVTVGLIDTGIQGSHVDINRNFSRRLSRNFTRDIPLVDGPCREEPDRSCRDRNNVDENGHGTHVAGTVAAPLNGRGIGGVAPNVTLVNLRAGQDSGYFFVQASVDALTYAGDRGIDVVNMSYFIDPWLYNCRNHPADSPAERREQRTIIRATQRALDYAYARDVTLISALGNSFTNLDRPRFDPISPDFPPGNEKERTVSTRCLTMPTEGRHVMGVSAVGPSGRKSFYSNWGLQDTNVAAPGGDSFDEPPAYPENQVLAPYPRRALVEADLLDPDGTPRIEEVVRDCGRTRCSYYAWLQGTSMASPHAVGVAALIVSEFGTAEGAGGLTMSPDEVQRRLQSSARNHACPPGGVQEYPELGPDADLFRATCVGTRNRNSFYGHGIVNALRAVTQGQ